MTNPTSPGQAETIRRVLETDRADLHTCLPGRVRSYDQANQTAEIELEIKQVLPAGDDDDADDVRPYPILPAVPVMCLRGSGFFVHLPLRAEDKVLVLFTEYDLNEWRRVGALSDPGVATRHGLAGAVCIPGIHHQRNPLSTADIGSATETPPHLVIGREGGPTIQVDSTSSQIRVGGSATLAVAEDVKAHLQKISADLTTVFAAAMAGTPTYIYATEIAADPIATTIVRGA